MDLLRAHMQDTARLYDDHSMNGTLSADGPSQKTVSFNDLLFVPMSASNVSRASLRCEEDQGEKRYYYECEGQVPNERCRLLMATSKMGAYEIHTVLGREKSTVGVLKQSVVGGRFSLFQHSILTLHIEYKCHIWKAYSPRAFKVVRASHAHLQGSAQAATACDLPTFVNRAPIYYARTGTYMLNFGGRVSSPSPINFLLVCPSEPSYTTITFGKHSHSVYVLDHTYPWSAYEAFGIGLAALIY